MIFSGDGIGLRQIERQDLETMRAWRNDEKIYQWCRQSDLITEPEQIAWFERVSVDPTIQMYAVMSARILGVAGLTSIDRHNRRAEFSLYIGPEYQRMGLARKALKTLLFHGFKNLGLNVIWGETFEGNPAMKLFESLGFTHEGTRRQFYFKGGKFINAHLISITAGEYLK